MKVSVAFIYKIGFVPYRHQNTQNRNAAASTTIEIRELTDSAAPVVIMIGSGREGRGEDRFSFKSDGSMREIRRFEGRLYVEDSDADALQAAADLDVNKTPLGHSYNTFSQKVTSALWTKDKIVAEHREPLRSISDDGGESVAKALQSRADRLLIVGGTIYKQCREPVLAIDPDDGIAEIREAPGNPYGSGLDTIDFIGKDMTSNLVEAAALLPLLPDGMEVSGKWEIRDPSFASFDGTSYDVGRKFKQINDALSSNSGGLQRSALDLYFAIRDAMPASLKVVTPEMLDLAADVRSLEVDDAELSNAFNCAATITRSAWGWSTMENTISARATVKHSDLFDRLISTAGELLARWDMKPANWIERKWKPLLDKDVSADADVRTPEFS
jgi:hypothetical protein